ncbi:MAG: Mov34/MPN/PAD-1 family protein, partial [Acidobacteriota bacterium]|nr:Mov34/MPN/PAD-1 family protein [Acidobacteriota bacterium]
MSIKITRALVEEMLAHAREARPEECCGLVGGARGGARSIYRLRNVARDPVRSYEAAPQEL